MEVDTFFVKIDDTKRTEIPVETMQEKELDEEGLKSKIRFFCELGYDPVDTT